MVAYTTAALCSIHNTGSNGSTRVTVVGEFIDSASKLSTVTVWKNCQIILPVEEDGCTKDILIMDYSRTS